MIHDGLKARTHVSLHGMSTVRSHSMIKCVDKKKKKKQDVTKFRSLYSFNKVYQKMAIKSLYRIILKTYK